MNFKRLVLSSLLILSTSLHAEPGRRGDRTPERDHWQNQQDSRDPWENSGSARDVELQLNRYFDGQARLNLLEDAYTRTQLQGLRIKEITITASSEQGNGQARLLVNQTASEQPRTVSRQMDVTLFKSTLLLIQSIKAYVH